MLMLSRKPGESIVIGGGIVVRVAALRADRVALAIDAPRDVPVDRLEVAERKQSARPEPADPRSSIFNPGRPDGRPDEGP